MERHFSIRIPSIKSKHPKKNNIRTKIKIPDLTSIKRPRPPTPHKDQQLTTIQFNLIQKPILIILRIYPPCFFTLSP